ncbi:MAG: 23S rRNA (pseudouridine(1915)-N(3))-methyltransferase RlmH [Candidatus Cloacimonadota bacterium]|nr:MAG: 23S rRNA (pseudouridine(1915)-N(3))-methyltransferase RlmH [Candidatus Cloacimonadota bacterium]
MKIKIFALGKSKQKFIEEGLQEYLKRLTRYAQIDFKILPDVKLTKTNSIEIVKEKEAIILEKQLAEFDFVIALDENGTQYSSKDFAKLIEMKKGKSNLAFIIGGVYGLSPKILNKANLILSFSKFTFTHQMIRFILTEQLYRAFTILEGKKYHY